MAEEKVILCIQKNSFGEKSKFQKNLPVFFDDKGLLRVKTRLVLNDDSEDFKLPILLPSGHPIVTRIIMELHVANQHDELQSMLVIVRDRFWILKSRKTIHNVLSHCAKCKRFKSKAGEAPVAPLPLERITECNAFQSTGIDLAGPLYLRNGEKSMGGFIHMCCVQSCALRAGTVSFNGIFHICFTTIYIQKRTNFTNLHRQWDQFCRYK